MRKRISDMERDIEEYKVQLKDLENKNRALSDPGRLSQQPVKADSKSTKHLWDELTKKEARIEELEK